MPCRDPDYGLPDPEPYPPRRLLVAALCGVFSSAARQATLHELLNEVDWKEAGVTQAEVLKWWNQHQKEDAKRKAEEQEKKQQETLRKKGLSKLSLAEQVALGLTKAKRK